MNECILSIDPGDHGGWCCMQDGVLYGGTLPKSYLVYKNLFDYWNPTVLIVEIFTLYAGKAQSQIGQTFFTCEVIGVLKMLCEGSGSGSGLQLKLQQASAKKYCSAVEVKRLISLVQPCSAIPIHKDFVSTGISEHTRDAIRHYVYYKMHEKL